MAVPVAARGRAPVVVAHRSMPVGVVAGSTRRRPIPQNSPAAIAACAVLGADAVEVDVRMTRDAQLVLGHDPVQWNRHGWSRRPYLVARSARGSVDFLSGLGEAMEVAQTARIDVKLDVKDAAALPEVARWCRERELDLARLALWCRSAQHLSRLAPGYGFAERALLSDTADAGRYVADAVACGATAVSFHPRMLTPAAVAAAHERGLTVYAWILDPRRHRTAVAWGVDGLVTDWVGEALAALS